METLPDVIRDMVINKMTWTELESKYHVSRNMIAKYRRKPVRELTKFYITREKQTEEYILR